MTNLKRLREWHEAKASVHCQSAGREFENHAETARILAVLEAVRADCGIDMTEAASHLPETKILRIAGPAAALRALVELLEGELC